LSGIAVILNVTLVLGLIDLNVTLAWVSNGATSPFVPETRFLV